MNLNIATEFSSRPMGRYRDRGDYSAEAFRDDVLAPKIQEALDNGEKLNISFDGLNHLGASFLEEVFGGMLRKKMYTYEQLKDTLEITSKQRHFDLYIEQAWEYIESNRNA